MYANHDSILITSHGKLTTNRDLCVYHLVLCFIPEGPTTGLEHLVSQSDCKEVILRFCWRLRQKKNDLSITSSDVLPFSKLSMILVGGGTLG